MSKSSRHFPSKRCLARAGIHAVACHRLDALHHLRWEQSCVLSRSDTLLLQTTGEDAATFVARLPGLRVRLIQGACLLDGLRLHLHQVVAAAVASTDKKRNAHRFRQLRILARARLFGFLQRGHTGAGAQVVHIRRAEVADVASIGDLSNSRLARSDLGPVCRLLNLEVGRHRVGVLAQLQGRFALRHRVVAGRAVRFNLQEKAQALVVTTIGAVKGKVLLIRAQLGGILRELAALPGGFDGAGRRRRDLAVGLGKLPKNVVHIQCQLRRHCGRRSLGEEGDAAKDRHTATDAEREHGPEEASARGRWHLRRLHQGLLSSAASTSKHLAISTTMLDRAT
mmetsp:Transcript_142948/g.456777  ORF Transcript_142948/g.456777 Transcript_142948/m.456777 type:complete len:339 (+) Transcript_142948:237-1253(+)